MTDWVNNGTVTDLSHLAKDSLAPTSQAGGNMMSSNAAAMTAKGSEPVDPLPDRAEQGAPVMDVPETETKTGTDGKPRAAAGSLNQSRPAWGYTKGGSSA